MSYKIVVDSCCELPEYLKKDPRFEIVPLGLEVDLMTGPRKKTVFIGLMPEV